jgi:hypothetical protein
VTKQQKRQAPTIPMEDHNREVSKLKETIRQLQESLEKQKQNGLKMAADYKKRFVEQQSIAEQKKAALAQALDAADAMRKEFEMRIEKLNQRHGETVKQLRVANEELTEELKRHKECAEASPAHDVPNEDKHVVEVVTDLKYTDLSAERPDGPETQEG